MSKVYVLKDGELYHAYIKSFDRQKADAIKTGSLRYFNKELEPMLINKISVDKKILDKGTIKIVSIKQEADWIWYTYRIGNGKVALTGGVKASYLQRYK